MNYHRDERYYAFKPMTENPLVLDFSQCHTWYELHGLLKDRFGLPEYYGQNWDALWDCLRGRFWEEGDFIVEIHGYSSMSDELREYSATMLEVFEDVHKDNPNVVFKYIS